MRCRSLLFVTVLVVLLAGSAYGEVQVFSPQGGCDQSLIRPARSAQTYFDAARYTFPLDPIADELIAAKERGVKIRVILDRRQAHQTWCPASRLTAAGIPVMVNTHGGLMHDKFPVADGKSVATGSFNWTKAAVEKNDENLVMFTGEVAVASTFAVQFDRMWDDTARFAPLSVTTTATAPAPLVAESENKGADTDTVYITKTGKRYHRAGCSSLRRSQIQISRKDAEARGYTPCRVCKP